ncbi:MAG: hypothetical protein SFU55_01100 [Methylophilus sp.]|nr:hypothetical protein [Methylophilus sp.]
MLIQKGLLAIVTLWHLCAFAAGGVYVFHAYGVLFFGGHNPAGVRIIRTADWQLWLSGFCIIGLGVMTEGFDHYVANPKLLAKIIVIVTWLISTQTIRRYAVIQLKTGNRIPMLLASSLNITCWTYGAFLGGADSLAYGVVSFNGLMLGFEVMLAAFLMLTVLLENRYQKNASPPK